MKAKKWLIAFALVVLCLCVIYFCWRDYTHNQYIKQSEIEERQHLEQLKDERTEWFFDNQSIFDAVVYEWRKNDVDKLVTDAEGFYIVLENEKEKIDDSEIEQMYPELWAVLQEYNTIMKNIEEVNYRVLNNGFPDGVKFIEFDVYDNKLEYIAGGSYISIEYSEESDLPYSDKICENWYIRSYLLYMDGI